MRKDEMAVNPEWYRIFFVVMVVFDGTHCIVIDACDVKKKFYKSNSFKIVQCDVIVMFAFSLYKVSTKIASSKMLFLSRIWIYLKIY